MLEIFENIKNIILNLSIFLPFIFAILLSLSYFIKNPIHIRNLSGGFFIINFIVISSIIFLVDKFDFSIFNLHFSLDTVSSLILFLSAFIFMLFSIFSKNSITKLYRVFYSCLAFLLGLIQTFALVDNIFISLQCIFWFMLIFYFMQNIYTKSKKEKQYLKFKLIENCAVFLVAIFLMGYDFIRYFLLNDIGFDYSNIANNLYHISDISISIAFIGFLILLFKFFNFIPFNATIIKNPNSSNAFIEIINTISSILIGLILLIKTYTMFDFLFYHYQEYIALYLIFNFIYYLILSYRTTSLLDFFINSIIPNIIIGLFGLFVFSSESVNQTIYYILSVIISYLLLGFIFLILINKFKTDLADNFKKITQKSFKLVFLFSILNLIRAPFLLMFSTTFSVLTSIFSFDWEGNILNLSIYIIAFGLFFIILNTLNLTHKILIEPNENPNFKMLTSKSSGFCCYILIFLTIIMAIGYQNIFNLMVNSFNIGS